MRELLISLCILHVWIADAQDSVSTSQIETAEKMADLHFTQVKRDSMASVLTDRIKTYNYLHGAAFHE